MGQPTLRRYYRGECVRCGRTLDRSPCPDTRLWRVLVGVVPAETVACGRCTSTARAKGFRHPKPAPITQEYVDAVYAALVEMEDGA